MQGADDRTPLSQRVYEFIRTRGCVTIEEVAKAFGISHSKAYISLRTLITKRQVLPYRPRVSRVRIYCIPDVGNRLYGPTAQLNSSGIVCITLPIETIEIIDEIAMHTGETRSGIIKQALNLLIDNYFGKDDQREQPEDRKQGLQEDGELDFIEPVR